MRHLKSPVMDTLRLSGLKCLRIPPLTAVRAVAFGLRIINHLIAPLFCSFSPASASAALHLNRFESTKIAKITAEIKATNAVNKTSWTESEF